MFIDASGYRGHKHNWVTIIVKPESSPLIFINPRRVLNDDCEVVP